MRLDKRWLNTYLQYYTQKQLKLSWLKVQKNNKAQHTLLIFVKFYKIIYNNKR